VLDLVLVTGVSVDYIPTKHSGFLDRGFSVRTATD